MLTENIEAEKFFLSTGKYYVAKTQNQHWK